MISVYRSSVERRKLRAARGSGITATMRASVTTSGDADVIKQPDHFIGEGNVERSRAAEPSKIN